MGAVTNLTRQVELDDIDRLEEKVRMLVALVGRLKAEQALARDEQARLGRDLEAARARVADLEKETAELASLRDEREAVRSRVSSLLADIETLQLG